MTQWQVFRNGRYRSVVLNPGSGDQCRSFGSGQQWDTVGKNSTSYFSSPFCIKFAMCILVQLLLLWLSYLLIRICAEWNTFLLLHILMSSFTQPVRQIVVRATTTVTLHLTLSQSRLQGSKTAVLQVKKRGVLVFRWGHLRAAASAWATQPRQQKKKKKVPLIYEWKSLQSIFWRPPRLTQRHKSLQNEQRKLGAVHFNVLLLILLTLWRAFQTHTYSNLIWTNQRLVLS